MFWKKNSFVPLLGFHSRNVCSQSLLNPCYLVLPCYDYYISLHIIVFMARCKLNESRPVNHSFFITEKLIFCLRIMLKEHCKYMYIEFYDLKRSLFPCLCVFHGKLCKGRKHCVNDGVRVQTTHVV